jgi:hypothetical protein
MLTASRNPQTPERASSGSVSTCRLGGGRLQVHWNTALLQYSVGGMSRLDLVVHRHVAAHYGAVSDVVITLTVAHEPTPVFSQDFADPLLELGHGSDGHKFASFRTETQCDLAADASVQGKEFWGGVPQALDQGIQGAAFQHQARNVVAGGNPHTGFLIPDQIN